MIYSARAVLCNGLGRYEDALAAAREAAADPLELGCAKMTPPKSSTGRRWSGSVGPRSAWSLPARSSFMVNGCAGGRRVDARAQLRTAHEELTAMGAEAFADRARRELTATGETVHRRTMQTQEELTDQEAHIARLAAEGLTNTEIAAALYLSPRTVEWHLRKIFAKLGVSTRRQLRRSTYADPKGTSG
jgi:DNA-binding CsgD family transcriptional regulator